MSNSVIITLIICATIIIVAWFGNKDNDKK